MQSRQIVYTLEMRYPFGITREVSTTSPTVLFRLADEGQGEGSPVKYKKQEPRGALPLLEKFASWVTEENITDVEGLHARAKREAPHHSSAVCAFDIALWDARGRREQKPLWQVMGAPEPNLQTTYTVSLAENELMEERAREASHLPLLKVKLGRSIEQDADAMHRIRRAAPNAILRIDANAGWSAGDALKIIPTLADLGVEFVEQPLPIGDLDGLARLHKESPLPVVADEDVQDMSTLDQLRGRVSGINIKLMKCGGLTEALKMIRYARHEGWSVMVGCMLETRLALGAASHIAGLVDCMDVDAHMLTTNDPFPPGSLKELAPDLPLAEGPGVGLPLLDI